MMYMLGFYLFSTNTTVPRTVQRSTGYTWAKQDRLNRSPALQPVGYGADTMRLEGVMYPCEQSGRSGKEQLMLMRLQAGLMKPLILVDGTGWVYGRWVVEGVEEGRSNLWADSDPRKITFSLALQAYGEDGRLDIIRRLGL